MAVYCHFWKITPDEFWGMDIPDYQALGRYMKRWDEEQNRR